MRRRVVCRTLTRRLLGTCTPRGRKDPPPVVMSPTLPTCPTAGVPTAGQCCAALLEEGRRSSDAWHLHEHRRGGMLGDGLEAMLGISGFHFRRGGVGGQ